ncbi:beta-1,3-galactosyltransferase 5-like [Cetorhinus maximus]
MKLPEMVKSEITDLLLLSIFGSLPFSPWLQPLSPLRTRLDTKMCLTVKALSNRMKANFRAQVLMGFVGSVIAQFQAQVYLSQYGVEHWHSAKLNDHSFLMLPNSSCDTSPPFLVLLVTSAQDQLEARSVIRQTWGRARTTHGKRVVSYFLLGYSREHQEQLLKESSLHKDIIQKNFTDTYYNLTTKVLMGLEWVSRFCPSTSFVMKTDSDMFVNTDHLTKLLLGMNHTDIFTGFITWNSGPIREKFSKWYVSEQEYPQKTYPPFCSGTGYMLSADVAHRVWIISRTVPHFKLEDVYVGLCLAELKITPVEIHLEQKFYNWNVKFSVCGFRKLITSHRVKPYELLIYWKALEDAADEACSGDG